MMKKENKKTENVEENEKGKSKNGSLFLNVLGTVAVVLVWIFASVVLLVLSLFFNDTGKSISGVAIFMELSVFFLPFILLGWIKSFWKAFFIYLCWVLFLFATLY